MAANTTGSSADFEEFGLYSNIKYHDNENLGQGATITHVM
jgi:hypothetical protein